LTGNQKDGLLGDMKATMEIADELYRQVKAKSALEGRAVREVAEELFRNYVRQEGASPRGGARAAERRSPVGGEPVPPWFGVLRKRARRVREHDLEAIRESVARGVAAERGR
jgi:hypothetical protein